MMKIIFLSLIIISSIYATTQFDKAMEAYNSKDYKLSAKLFKKLFLNDMTNSKYSFYLGKSYYELGKYNLAISTFERLLINKENTRAEFEIARIYLKQKNYLEAKKIFDDIYTKVKSDKLKKNIKQYLSTIDNKLSKLTISGLIMVGSTYDSNLKNRADVDSFNISNVTYQNTTEKQASYSIEQLGMIDYNYKKSARMSLHNKLLATVKMVDRYSEHNLGLLSINPYLSYLLDTNLKLSYGVYFNRLWYGDRLYLNTYGTNISFNYQGDELRNYDIKFDFSKKENKIDDYKNRDAKHYNLGFILNQKSSRVLSYIPSINIESERKIKNTNIAVDYDAIDVKFLVKYIYQDRYIFTPYISYKTKQYNDINSIYNKKQLDNELDIVASGMYLLNRLQSIQSSIGYYSVDSNIDSATYDKYKFSFYLINKF